MPPGPGVRDDIGSEIIELLLSWGAHHDHEIGPLLGVAAPRTGLPETVRALHRTARPLLPEDLRHEIAALMPLLRDATETAPSLRARMQRVVDSAAPWLDKAVADRQAALRDTLLRKGTVLSADGLTGALHALWSSEACPGLAERLRALSDLDAAVDRLDRSHAPPLGPEMREPASRAGTAPHSGDFRERLASMGTLLERQTGPGPEDPMGALRLEAAREYQLLVDQHLSQAYSGAEIESLLSVWEHVLAPALAKERPAAADLPLESIRARLDDAARESDALPGNQDAGQAASLAGEVRGARGFGNAAVSTANAAAYLARVRGLSQANRKTVTSRLQALAREVGELLGAQAPLLPSERLVQARIRLEQAPSIIAAGTEDEIRALEKAVRLDLSELQSLASAGKQQRTRHAERQREKLQKRADEIGRVAGRGAARKLVRLQSAVGSADGRQLGSLLERLDQLERSMEQSVRLFAAREAGRARRWLDGHARGDGKNERPGARELAKQADELSKALGGDDLSAIRGAALEVRVRYRRLVPTARPSLRVAASLLLLTVAAGTVLGWNAVRNREHSVRVNLSGEWSEMWLVRNGRIAKKVENTGPEANRVLSLAPGRYDVYLDQRFTGRVIRVPEDDAITDTPLPAP